MTSVSSWGQVFRDEPYFALAFAAALLAMALTPIAFAVLARTPFFEARRGRTYQRPSFVSVVCGMALVMAVPAIFAALVVKSRYYDQDRFEFDPNRLAERSPEERKRLDSERNKLVDSVKALDLELLKLRALATVSRPVAEAMNPALDKLAVVRKAVGLDAPIQRIEEVGLPEGLPGAPVLVASASAPVAPVAAPGPGLPLALAQAEVAAVPEPQRALAAMLPLSDVPKGWTVGEMAGKHLETFNAENLFEKINGRAESFVQFGIKGMAYANYHPEGDDSSEVQVYVFELGSPLKALGKYGTERPAEGTVPVEVGSEGYASAGSTFFYYDRYYTQIVSSDLGPKASEFALELARRVAEKQGAPVKATTAVPPPTTAEAMPKPMPKPKPAPELVFKLLPDGPGKDRPQFIVEDVFGYSFLTNVFLAEYKEGGDGFQGFLRPCASPEAAKALMEKYVSAAKADMAEVKVLEGKEADSLVLASNIGLVDVVFVKGNVFGGANGATAPGPPEAFARKLAAGLPADVPALEEDEPAPSDADRP